MEITNFTVYMLKEIFVIFIAVLIVDILLNWYHNRRNRGLNRLYCEACEELKPTYKIPTRGYRLCKVCTEELFKIDETITEEQKERVRKKYKERLRTKRRKMKKEHFKSVIKIYKRFLDLF